jgi:hypothetical protein
MHVDLTEDYSIESNPCYAQIKKIENSESKWNTFPHVDCINTFTLQFLHNLHLISKQLIGIFELLT